VFEHGQHGPSYTVLINNVNGFVFSSRVGCYRERREKVYPRFWVVIAIAHGSPRLIISIRSTRLDLTAKCEGRRPERDS